MTTLQEHDGQLPTGEAAPSSAGFSQSLGRGLQVLTSFTQQHPVLGIADIARAVQLNKSTTHRYVATLTRLDYLRQDPVTKKYELGPRVADLGFAAISSLEVTRVAAIHLQALSDETGYPVSMAILDGPDIVYVDRRRSGRPGTQGVDLNLHVGSRLPAYCTSMGKVLLADLDPRSLRRLLDRTDLARRGPRTITAREQLLSVLERTRRLGIAVNDEELAQGLRSLAAPVRDRSGQAIAAVNVAVHLSNGGGSAETMLARLEAPLRRTAGEISARMGYRGHADASRLPLPARAPARAGV